MSFAEPIWAGGRDTAQTEAGHMIAVEPPSIFAIPLESNGPFSNRLSLVNELLLPPRYWVLVAA